MHDDVKEMNMHEEDKRKNPAYFSKLVSSFIERCAKRSSSVEVLHTLPTTEFPTPPHPYPC